MTTTTDQRNELNKALNEAKALLRICRKQFETKGAEYNNEAVKGSINDFLNKWK